MIKFLLLILCLLVQHIDGSLLELGRGERVKKPAGVPAREIKIISYNIRWRSGEQLKLLINFLKGDPEVGGAAILCLQEVDRRKKRSGNANTAKIIADQLGMHYAWAAPPT